MPARQFFHIYFAYLCLIKLTAAFVCYNKIPVFYNPKTQVCKNGTLHNIFSPQPAPGTTQPPLETTTFRIGPIITESTPPPTTPPKPTHTVNFTCTDGLLLINCSNAYYCSASADFMCCGYEPYFPEYDTCCAQTPTHAMVHSGKPERNHVCCRGIGYKTVYPRDPKTIPCIHPALNDRLESAPTLKKDDVTKKLCRQLEKSGIVLKVLRFDESTKQYRTKITRYFQSRGDKSRRRQDARKSGVNAKRRTHLQMDAYSQKTLTRRQFLLTGIKILHGGQIYLKSDVDVFALKKKSKSVKRKIKKLRKWCKQFSVVM